MGMTFAKLRSIPLLLAAAFVQPSFGALTVTAPPAGSTMVPAGNDFATQVIGDAWDMSNPQDIDTDESANLTTQTFSGGLFSATASACPAAFWPHFVGYGSQIVAIKRGPRYPINTSVYRYFTIKLKTSTSQQDHLFFFQNGDTGVQANIGASTYQVTPANAWTIQTWDMYTDTFGSPYQPWTSFPTVQGIRFDPCNTGAPAIQVDWIRLTAPPTTGNLYTVTWSDPGGSGPYTVVAFDGDNATYTFTTNAGGTSYSADLSRLAPGDYHIQVSRSGASGTSAGVLHINAPPQVQITAPTQRGEQALSYALVEQGVQWAVPMSGADFKSVVNFTNVTYSNPSFPGSFSGRPITSDTQFIMQTTGHNIDASLYRSVCFTLEVFGTRDVGNGSIARLFWGVDSAHVSTTKDIILGNGLVEYCLPDLADANAVPLVTGSPQPWAGSLGYFRMDPDELTPPNGCNTPDTCHDVRLDSVVLSPFAQANPGYTFAWTLTDADDASDALEIYLDPDTTPGNGNEILIGSTTANNGSGQLAWPGSNSVNYGTYHVLFVVNDGKNSVSQYAGGPLVVGARDGIFRNGFEGP
jgi:hypothetical protein